MRKLKIAILFLCLFALASVAVADSPNKFENFPTLGRCTGSGVRLREDPGTDSEILGKLNRDDSVVVLDRFITDGDVWYEVDHPTQEGSAFVFGKYLEAVYAENYQDNPLHKLIMQLYLTYGITPEKAVSLFGKPKNEKRDTIGGGEYERVSMSWKNCSVEYVNNLLTSVVISGGDKAFGNIKIGDSTDKLIQNFGEPSDQSTGAYSYQESEIVYINFDVDKNRVKNMSYQVYYDIEE